MTSKKRPEEVSLCDAHECNEPATWLLELAPAAFREESSYYGYCTLHKVEFEKSALKLPKHRRADFWKRNRLTPIEGVK